MESSKTTYLKLENRLGITSAVLMAIVAGLMTLIWFLNSRALIYQAASERLINTLVLVASQIDTRTHSRLVVKQDYFDEGYRDLHTSLLHMIEANHNLKEIYTLRQNNGGELVYVMDAVADPNQVPRISELYTQASPRLLSNFATLASAQTEQGFFPDRGRTEITGYIPLFLPDGRRESVLVIQMNAPDIASNENSLVGLSILILVVAIPLVAGMGWLAGRRLAAPLTELAQGARRLAAGDLNSQVEIDSQDEFGLLAEAFNQMASQLKETINTLEQRVKDRTRELARHSNFLEAAAAVAHASSSILDSEQLAQEVVEVILQRFGLYYVGLFITDEKGEWAVLKAGTSEAGKAMLRRGHKIRIGAGMIGWSISNAQARIAHDAQKDDIRLRTPELPDTRSEAALPLRSRGRVIGALSVQSERPGAFDQGSLIVLQTMADQVAVALENARLFASSQANLEMMRQAYSQLSQKAWGEMLRSRPEIGYQCDDTGVFAIAANRKNTAFTEKDSETSLTLPIQVRGQELGVLEAHKPDEGGEWTKEELGLAQVLIDQLGVALESARLYQETQRRAERERLAGEISAKVRASNNPQQILQTAVQELHAALNAQRTQILLHPVQEIPNPEAGRSFPPPRPVKGAGHNGFHDQEKD